MRIRPVLPLFLAAAVATTAHAAVDGDARKAAADQLAASRNYAAFCADCHGAQGGGDGKAVASFGRAVPDFRTPQAVVLYSLERMTRGLTAGHAEPTRAGWESKLSQQEVANVIAYMREAFMLPAPTVDASAGRAIYARTCSVCHGDRGNGASWAQNSLNPSPRDFTAPKAKELSRRHMINTVTYGSPSSAMKGFAVQMSRAEIAAVVDYIRSTFVFPQGIPADDGIPKVENRGHAGHDAGGGADRHAAHGHATGPADMSLPMPDGLVADAGWGKAFFDKNCAVCHGAKGDGQGPRAYFIQPKPANFLTPESREEFNRPNLVQRIADGSPGSEMPAWSKVLSRQEIANVAEYVFTAFIRPASAELPAGPAWEQKKNP